MHLYLSFDQSILTWQPGVVRSNVTMWRVCLFVTVSVSLSIDVCGFWECV